MRYKFYREHKFVSAALNDVERLAAKTDFRSAEETARLRQQFEKLVAMLVGHAQYEDEKLHPLLKEKKSTVFEQVEKDHEEQELDIKYLFKLLNKVLDSKSDDDKVENGYQFYLYFRKFVSNNLAHLHVEETVILPELQRLYPDVELKKVEAKTYNIMTVEEMVGMMEVLFPHMNSTDKAAFLQDIKDAEPEKFKLALKGIESFVDPRDVKSVTD